MKRVDASKMTVQNYKKSAKSDSINSERICQKVETMVKNVILGMNEGKK